MKKTLFSSLLSLSAGIFLLTAAAQADVLKIKPSHPDRYTVLKGDTLWDISGRFLEHPWQWPEIWQINPQIEDPHPKKSSINDGKVIGFTKPGLLIASMDTVIIDRGQANGVTRGDVFALSRDGRRINDPQDQTKLQLPEESVGLAMVYKTFDQVSYALVMESHRGIQIGDHLRQP